MLRFFRSRRPKPVVDPRPELAEARVMSAWGMNEDQWRSLSDFERANCRRNIVTAPWFVA
jgi:hypothetical protein